MKSEKAKEYIDKEILHMDDDRRKDSYGYNEERDGISYLEIDEVRRAVELAEQEAEEQMREKAVKAYCQGCCCAILGECGVGSENCVALRDFIRKLNENETD